MIKASLDCANSCKARKMGGRAGSAHFAQIYYQKNTQCWIGSMAWLVTR